MPMLIILMMMTMTMVADVVALYSLGFLQAAAAAATTTTRTWSL